MVETIIIAVRCLNNSLRVNANYVFKQIKNSFVGKKIYFSQFEPIIKVIKLSVDVQMYI